MEHNVTTMSTQGHWYRAKSYLFI